MKFEPENKKLRIVAETSEEFAWISTVRHLTIKPGAERFVLRAFQDWKASLGGRDPLVVAIKTGRQSRQLAHERRQAEESAARLERGETVAHACRLWQETYRTSPRFDVTYLEPELVRVDMVDGELMFSRVATGYGPNKAVAKAKAAEAFLRGE